MWLFRFESWPGSSVGMTRALPADVADPPSRDPLTAVILAAGMGTRMRSRHPKVLHPLCGKPIIQRVLGLVAGAGASQVVVVVGHGADEVRAALPESVI